MRCSRVWGAPESSKISVASVKKPKTFGPVREMAMAVRPVLVDSYLGSVNIWTGGVGWRRLLGDGGGTVVRGKLGYRLEGHDAPHQRCSLRPCGSETGKAMDSSKSVRR